MSIRGLLHQRTHSEMFLDLEKDAGRSPCPRPEWRAARKLWHRRVDEVGGSHDGQLIQRAHRPITEIADSDFHARWDIGSGNQQRDPRSTRLRPVPRCATTSRPDAGWWSKFEHFQ